MQKFLRESLSDDYECEVARKRAQLLQTRHFDLTSSDVMMRVWMVSAFAKK
ncbi:MAG: hypothetical protein R2778_12100 [Saprospiraceae bacterium]